MSKSRVCIEKSYNAAKQCGKKSSMLIYEKPTRMTCPRGEPTFRASLDNPKLKRIRLCTGADLKKTCPPPPATKGESESMTLAESIYRLIVLSLKGLLTLGIAYVTVEIGIWGSSRRTSELYNNFLCAMSSNLSNSDIEENSPTLSDACEAESELFGTTPTPTCEEALARKHEENVYGMKRRWNKLIFMIFSNVTYLPNQISGAIGNTDDKQQPGGSQQNCDN